MPNEGGKTGNVYINENQHFSDVPKVDWEYYIGGYQPAQKWLKYRKGRPIDMADFQHYRKLIKAFLETERLIGRVDGVLRFEVKFIAASHRTNIAWWVETLVFHRFQKLGLDINISL